MTLNDTLAKYSDWSFEAAFAVVVLAMLLLVIEYATYRSKLVAERELVAAGGVGSSPAETVPGRVENTAGRTCRSGSATWDAPSSWWPRR